MSVRHFVCFLLSIFNEKFVQLTKIVFWKHVLIIELLRMLKLRLKYVQRVFPIFLIDFVFVCMSVSLGVCGSFRVCPTILLLSLSLSVFLSVCLPLCLCLCLSLSLSLSFSLSLSLSLSLALYLSI